METAITLKPFELNVQGFGLFSMSDNWSEVYGDDVISYFNFVESPIECVVDTYSAVNFLLVAKA